jgi:hypothetical protein
MRKIILTLVGAALVAGSTAPVAFAKERHHVRNVQQFNSERFRKAKAYYAVPPYIQPGASSYSGEDGAWQTMTGFGG